MKPKQPLILTPIQTTLDYVIWMIEVEKLASIKRINQRFLYRCWSEGYTPESFYDNHVCLPFN